MANTGDLTPAGKTGVCLNISRRDCDWIYGATHMLFISGWSRLVWLMLYLDMYVDPVREAHVKLTCIPPYLFT